VQLTRKDLLKAGMAGAVLLWPLGKGIEAAIGPNEIDIESPPVTPFTLPLKIPPVISPVATVGTTDFFEVENRLARVEIIPGLATTVFSYNGTVPGPTFITRKGRRQVVRHTNRLLESITVHRHGGDQAPEDDGHPIDLVPPGASKDYHYPGLNPAATLWYHDHAVNVTGRHVYMGLAGFFIIHDEEEQALGLPSGPFDVPLAIQDKLFLADGTLFYPVHDPTRPVRQGVFGDTILVNAVPTPFFQVQRRRYRFRILDGSTARWYRLVLSTGDPLVVIASDGGLLPRAVETPDLLIGPSMRYEIVIDFSRYRVGQKVELRNIFPPSFGDPIPPEKTRRIMRFDVVGDAVDDSRVPQDLVPSRAPREAEAVAVRDFRFDRSDGAWTINGLRFDPNRIDAFPKLDTVEIWRFTNKSGGWIHPIHVHLVEYFVLDRNGKPPEVYETGPKDSVFLGPDQVVRVIMRFEDFTGTYVFHCHNNEHEDHDMMSQFRVV